jgi:hypothetical protein
MCLPELPNRRFWRRAYWLGLVLVSATEVAAAFSAAGSGLRFVNNSGCRQNAGRIRRDFLFRRHGARCDPRRLSGGPNDLLLPDGRDVADDMIFGQPQMIGLGPDIDANVQIHVPARGLVSPTNHSPVLAGHHSQQPNGPRLSRARGPFVKKVHDLIGPR